MKLQYTTDAATVDVPFSVTEATVDGITTYTYTVPQSALSGRKIDKLYILEDDFVCPCGAGYMFYPTNCAQGVVLTNLTPRQNASFQGQLTSMAIAGVGANAYAAYFQALTMAYDLCFHVSVTDNVYTLRPEIWLNGDEPEEDLIFQIHKMPHATYATMARHYRQYLLTHGCRLIRDRIQESPALAYAATAPELRIRMGWKPVPTPCMHQTPETEPPLLVKVDVPRLNELIERMHQANVGKMELCLVGWGQGGHDGRFPQQVPVSPEYGKEDADAEMKAFVAKAQDYGYAVVAHTNSVCAYEIADNWDPELTTKKLVDGVPTPMLRMGYVNSGGLSGGAPYHVCAKTAYEHYGVTDLPKVQEYGFAGLHFIDELTACTPEKCYDPHHGVSRKAAWDYNRKLAKLSKELFGGFQSEAWYDYMNEDVDAILYTSFCFQVTPKVHPLFDRDIPLWQLLYHGIVLSNPTSHTVNYPLKGKKSLLKMLEYGGRPLLYLYSKFGEHKNWMGDIDLHCHTEEEWDTCIAALQEACAYCATYGHLEYETMDDHECLADGVYRTTYSDGTVITVDHGAETFSAEKN